MESARLIVEIMENEMEGICANCGHEHKSKWCSQRVIFAQTRVCFGPNPHVHTEYSECFCHDFKPLKDEFDAVELMTAVHTYFQNQAEMHPGNTLFGSCRFLDVAKAQSQAFRILYYLKNGKRWNDR